MGEKFSFNYSFNLQGDGQQKPNIAQKKEADLIAFDALEPYSLPNQSVVVLAESSNKQTIISRDVYIALDHCRELRTLDQHVDFLIQKMPELKGNKAAITKVIQSVHDAGLMFSANDFCKGLVAKHTPQAKPLPPVISIHTCDRPQQLERLFNSLADNGNFDTLHETYVVDDSRNNDHIRRNQQIISTFNDKNGLHVRYLGAHKQQNLVDQLISKLPEHEEGIRFLFDRTSKKDLFSCGLARNFGLLLSIGKRLISIDDDVIVKLYQPKNHRPGIEISTKIRALDFYSSNSECIDDAVELNVDPLQEVARCLGANLEQALAHINVDAVSASQISDSPLEILKNVHPDSTILTTSSGSLGDPGTGGIDWLTQINDACLERLLSSPGKLDKVFTQRSVWLGRNTPQLSPASVMSQVTGLDNRHELPPYFPLYRVEDLIFGQMVEFLYPTSLCLDYAHAFPHIPIPERTTYPHDSSLRVSSTSNTIITLFNSLRSNSMANSYQTRLELLIASLQELCNKDDESLGRLHYQLITKARVKKITKLTDLVNNSDSNQRMWVNYLQQGIEDNSADIQNQDTSLLSELNHDQQNENPIGQFKSLGKQFAASLSAWPEIRQHAPAITKHLFDDEPIS